MIIPEFALVVLVGTSGSGKSTFAAKHFRPTEIISSDFCRGLVADDENSLEATSDAFDVLHYIAGKRLKRKKLTVIDATSVRPEDRKHLVQLARDHHCLAVAIVLNVPSKIAIARNETRPDRNFGGHVVRNQQRTLRRGLRSLRKREGFRTVTILDSVEAIDALTITREPLWTNKRDEHGPFDFIGDVHGCCDELETLLAQLGYQFTQRDSAKLGYERTYTNPDGRKAVFVGDLVDRGPRSLDVIGLVANMVNSGSGICVPGNHDMKFMRWLKGRNVRVAYGLSLTIGELEALPDTIRDQRKRDLTAFLDGLISHYELDDGKVVVAHAGMKEEMQGRASGQVRQFALYGETTGETDEFGLPVRYPWAQDYRGKSLIVYGHTPIPEPEWLNNTINIDTGCVFGGSLTALRYPERELVSVPAQREYAKSKRPLVKQDDRSAQQMSDDVLDISEVIGKQIVSTRLRSNITIRAENAAAALEIVSRFAVDPKWLIYLPPTMSPVETSQREGYLEYPDEAFAYFREQGVEQVVCEEKHMGSRAIVIVCQQPTVARTRFGIADDALGVIYTRTGRRFFDDTALENDLLDVVRKALDKVDFWQRYNTEWVCLDCELMPWSAKAQALLQEQYAAVGSAAIASLSAANELLHQASQRSLPIEALSTKWQSKQDAVSSYIEAYQHYCWPVTSLADLRLAPFHILATEGAVHADKNHEWHMAEIGRFVTDRSVTDAPDLLFRTTYKTVTLQDPASYTDAVAWWVAMTAKGGEGMVVKPLDFIAKGKKGLVQPALKVRGQQYLRLIYGAEYDSAENLPRLRKRSVGRKRSLALREFALGIEALESFIRRAPLRKTHRCVFGILALESEPVDPRL